MNTKWEFDAPQYIDFTQPDAFASEYDDTWFDRHTEDDDFRGHGKQTRPTGATGIAIGQPQRVVKDPVAVKAEYTETEGKQLRNSDKKTSVMNKERKANPESNSEKLGPSPKKRQKLSDDAVKQPSSSMTQLKAFSGDNADSSPAANTRLKAQNNQASLGFGSRGTSPAQPKKKPANEAAHAYSLSPKPEKLTKACPLTRSQSVRVKNLTKVGSTSNLKMAIIKHCSPGRQYNSSNDLSKPKTTEELELEKIAQLQKEAAKMRKLAQESYNKAMNADNYIPLRSKQPATIPVQFNFKTDERIKNVDGHGSEQRVKEFTKSLREALPISVLPGKPTIHGLTKPQPFHLHTQKKTAPQPTEKYESVAERVAAFQNKTPARFRSHPKEGNERSRSATKSKPASGDKRLRSESPKLTIPKTPNLTTRGRSRPVHIPTREEKELQEFEEHKKQQFKAHPVNQKIFEVPNVGVPKAAPKPPTVAEGFKFNYKKSASVTDLRDTSTAASNYEEEKFEFHAKPVNPKILQGTVGIPFVEPQPITVPQSPAFALRSRVRLPVANPVQEEPQPIVKANPVPFNGVPFRPKLAHSVTVPEPFPVEERSREMLSKKEQKIQQILEEERKAREFHARDLPSDSPDVLPPKQARPPTQPEPFKMAIDERGEKYQQQFRSKIEEEERAAIEAARFKAGPNSVVHKEPFLPQKSNKPLTEISEFDLNTEHRAVDRELFDQRTKAHEAHLEAVKRQKEEEREREERAAIARMRQEAVHKASGIKKYKTVVVKPSDKPLTEAKSPKFSLRLRSRLENTQNTDV